MGPMRLLGRDADWGMGTASARISRAGGYHRIAFCKPETSTLPVVSSEIEDMANAECVAELKLSTDITMSCFGRVSAYLLSPYLASDYHHLQPLSTEELTLWASEPGIRPK